MTNFLIFTGLLLTSFIFALVLTLLYIWQIEQRPGICCHHKPEPVLSPANGIRYFQCRKCNSRTFKADNNVDIWGTEPSVNLAWLCGKDKVL